MGGLGTGVGGLGVSEVGDVLGGERNVELGAEAAALFVVGLVGLLLVYEVFIYVVCAKRGRRLFAGGRGGLRASIAR